MSYWSQILNAVEFLKAGLRPGQINSTDAKASVFFAGLGTVLIARWFWWRVNATTELASLVATVVLGTFVLIFLPNYEVNGETIDLFGLRVLLMTFGVAAVWIPIALISSTVPSEAALTLRI